MACSGVQKRAGWIPNVAQIGPTRVRMRVRPLDRSDVAQQAPQSLPGSGVVAVEGGHDQALCSARHPVSGGLLGPLGLVRRPVLPPLPQLLAHRPYVAARLARVERAAVCRARCGCSASTPWAPRFHGVQPFGGFHPLACAIFAHSGQGLAPLNSAMALLAITRAFWAAPLLSQ